MIWYYKEMKKYIFIILLIKTVNIFCQVSEGGTPFFYNRDILNEDNLKSKVILEQVILPEVDNQTEIIKSDSVSQLKGIKRGYYGKIMNTDIDLINDAGIIDTDNGKIQLYHIYSPTAYGMQFFFDKYKLPEGAKLYIFNEERSMKLGAFTINNNNSDNNFGTQYITGNSVFLEYFIPDNTDEISAELHLNKVVHVFKPLRSAVGEWGTSGDCNIDVACDDDPEIQELAHSVALILCIDYDNWYSYWCSGTLINNTMNNKRSLFLSASHCADINRVYEGYDEENFDYTRWLFIFNYQNKSCNSSLPVSTNSVYGAKLLSVDTNVNYNYLSDHLLLELNATADQLESYNVAYAGWDANESDVYNTTYTKCIHHPAGDSKKVSYSSYTPISSSANNHYDNQWQVYWTSGVTEDGSSGSPLFNDEYKIIGYLYGGSSYCSSPYAPDFYSKLSLAYDVGKLQQWLDPADYGIRSVQSLIPESVTPEPDITVLFVQVSSGEYEVILKEKVSLKTDVIAEVYNSVGKRIIYNVMDPTNIIEFSMDECPAGIYFFRLQYNYETYENTFFYSK